MEQVTTHPADIALLLRHHGGTLTTRQLLRRFTRRELETACRAGYLIRARRGVYLGAAASPLRRAAVEAGGAASHLSAAGHLGLDVWTAPAVAHVTVPPSRRARRRPGVRLHWRDLDPDDVRGDVTRPLRTVLDCAGSEPFPEALAIADSALRSGMVEREQLLAAGDAEPRSTRGRCLAVARAADPRAANAFESVLRGTLIRAGMRCFVPQYPVALPRFTAHVDLGDPATRLAVEAEGFTYHAHHDAFTADCERYDELVAAGWGVLRITVAQLRRDPSEVVRLVGAARRERRTQRRKPGP